MESVPRIDRRTKSGWQTLACLLELARVHTFLKGNLPLHLLASIEEHIVRLLDVLSDWGKWA